jgi:hypothetical protein
MDLNSSEDEDAPSPAGPGPSMAAAPIEVIDLCDDTPIAAHSPEAEDAALARRLQAEEYGELPPDWNPSEGYGQQQPPSSGGGTSKRRSTSEPAKSKAAPTARSTGGSSGDKAPKPPPKPTHPPATSVYTKSLDAALDAALSAAAADGAPLFTEAERQLLQTVRSLEAWLPSPSPSPRPRPRPRPRPSPSPGPSPKQVRSLEAAPRCLLVHLLLLKDPWHACASLTRYVPDIPAAVAALARAGALLTYQARFRCKNPCPTANPPSSLPSPSPVQPRPFSPLQTPCAAGAHIYARADA